MTRPMMVAAAIVFVAAQAGRADLVYVTEDNGTVVRYDTASPTPAPVTVVSGLTNPASLAFDRSGNLFIATQVGMSGFVAQNTILKDTPGGTLSTFASGLSFIQGLATDASGNLYASSAGTSSILKFTPGGAASTYASNFVGPTGLATDAAGDLFVAVNANQNQVSKITPGGAVSTYALGFSNPLGLATDPSGNLYVAVNGFNEVSEITPAGKQTYVSTSPYIITGLAVDSSGDVLFTGRNFSTGLIGEITPNGTVSVFATTASIPEYIAIAPAAVPEPSSLVLMGAGLAVAATAFGRRVRGASKAALRIEGTGGTSLDGSTGP